MNVVSVVLNLLSSITVARSVIATVLSGVSTPESN